MWDDLNGRAEEFTFSLTTDNVLVNAPRSKVIMTGHAGTDETLIMTQIEVCFCAIDGDENFTVLDRAHRAWIDVNVRVEL